MMIAHLTSTVHSLASTEVPVAVPPIACPTCTHAGPHQVGPGAGPHHARLVCGQCGHYLRWLPRPRPVAQEGR